MPVYRLERVEELGRNSIQSWKVSWKVSRTHDDFRDYFQDVFTTDLNCILSLLNWKCLDSTGEGHFLEYFRDTFQDIFRDNFQDTFQDCIELRPRSSSRGRQSHSSSSRGGRTSSSWSMSATASCSTTSSTWTRSKRTQGRGTIHAVCFISNTLISTIVGFQQIFWTKSARYITLKLKNCLWGPILMFIFPNLDLCDKR